MTFQRLKAVGKGEYLKRSEGAHKVYKRGDYCRSTRKYWIIDTEDVNRSMLLKGDTQVFIDFTY